MNHPYEERYQVEPFIGSATSGGFTAEEIKGTGQNYLYHAIHIIDTGSNKGKARLALDYDRVDGSFVSFDGGLSGSPLIIYSFRQKGMRFRNGTNAVIPLGSKIIGSLRSGATPEYGYVMQYVPQSDFDNTGEWDEVTLAIINTIDGSASQTQATTFIDAVAESVGNMIISAQKARGIVRGPDGAAHTTLATRPEADVIVEFGFE